MSIPYQISTIALSFFYAGKFYTASCTHPGFEEARKALIAGTATGDELVALIDVREALSRETHGNVTIEGDTVSYRGEELHGHLVDRLLAIRAEGGDVKPWLAFMERVLLNPSYQARREIPLFLETAKLPITPDGYVLAWKVVRDDYRDFYSGKFDHSVGSTLEMPRHSVDDNRQNTCSSGFHFAAYEYLPHYHWGDNARVVVVKIDPKDIVSIPYDYNNAKGRTCKYTVVDEVPKEEVEKFFGDRQVYDSYMDEYSDDEEYYYGDEDYEDSLS